MLDGEAMIDTEALERELRDVLRDRETLILRAANALAAQREEIADLRQALRTAPMPIVESMTEEWDEAYDHWWHANASEQAIDAARKASHDDR